MRSAAPGVDQATMTGIRVNRLSAILHTPLPMQSAHTQEAVCASLSPTARVASSTMRNGPAKLISADRKPAITAESDMSRQTGVRGAVIGYPVTIPGRGPG